MAIETSPEMVERVARAMLLSIQNYARRALPTLFPPSWEDITEKNREVWRDTAREAIRAMRAPTQAMLDAISEGCGATPECEMDADIARQRINAMIDAALGTSEKIKPAHNTNS